jgi:hypothetical protein
MHQLECGLKMEDKRRTSLSSLDTNADQRAEWERLLLGSRMRAGEDLPQEFRELLRKLDRKIAARPIRPDAPAEAEDQPEG